ncbi:MAG: penicillin-binding transpeptidase domain-containing protein [Oscillospiraceae bacterium]
MGKRVLGIYLAIIICFTGLIAKLYMLTSGENLAQAAENQSKYTIQIDKSRGYIYDKNLMPLTNTSYDYKATVLPCPEAANALLEENIVADREFLLSNLENHSPFVINVSTDQIYAKGVNVFKILKRYPTNSIAPHIIGHLGAEGQGLMGIEHAYDEYLKGYEGELQQTFTTNAVGEPLLGEMGVVVNDGYGDKHGVVLTLDSDIQRIAQIAAKDRIKSGAVVVMDVKNGNILASVSLPEFDPNNLEKDLNNKDKPFFNRAFAPTNVGSTFKIIVAACALEKGIGIDKTYECKGHIEVGDMVFHCQNRNGHGALNMEGAMEWSCNPYFINLAKEVGVQTIAHKAAQIGLGKSYEIMPGHFTSSGKLPNFNELENIGEAANFSFGQGMMTASPVQVTQMVSCIANGGIAVSPRIVEGFTNDGITISEHNEASAGVQVIEEDVAKTVVKLMGKVVSQGSGKKANPVEGEAGGKTGSAQTGIFDEDGKEQVQAWFTGFYPLNNPKYAITVLAENEVSGGDICAPIFKEICDNLSLIG